MLRCCVLLKKSKFIESWNGLGLLETNTIVLYLNYAHSIYFISLIQALAMYVRLINKLSLYTAPNIFCSNGERPQTYLEIQHSLARPAFVDNSGYFANRHKIHFDTVCEASVYIDLPPDLVPRLNAVAGRHNMAWPKSILFLLHVYGNNTIAVNKGFGQWTVYRSLAVLSWKSLLQLIHRDSVIFLLKII